MKLSRLELEVLQLISEQSETTAPDIHDLISQKRDTAYSTIKTIFDRLEDKNAIFRKSKVGRTSIYAARVSPESVQKSLVQEFVDSIFPEDRIPLFNTLIRDSELSEEEIQYLKKLLKDQKVKS
jgi:BlaI family penicillinase repressor